MTASRHLASDRNEPSLAELSELARYTADRVAHYRRKVYLGRGLPNRLAELERVAAGAAERLRIAEEKSAP